jgi:probable rRNA maturation factor
MRRVRAQRSPALRALHPRRSGELAATRLLPRLRDAARATLHAEGIERAVLSITLLTDDEIAALNRDYLGHDGPTDVISFALHEETAPPVGDIYIGFDRALEQAEDHGTAAAEELLRLAVHGTLHVLGHDHPDGPARTRSAMWRRQESIVASLARPAQRRAR